MNNIIKSIYISLKINEDIKSDNCEKLLNQEVDLDKPGAAQFYCVHCAKYFINNRALEDHFRTKVNIIKYFVDNIRIV